MAHLFSLLYFSGVNTEALGKEAVYTANERESRNEKSASILIEKILFVEFLSMPKECCIRRGKYSKYIPVLDRLLKQITTR